MLTQKRFWFSLLILVTASYLLFRNVDLRKLLEGMARFDLPWLLPALAVYCLGYIVRGYRWVILLSPIKRCTFGSLFPTLVVGFMANNILPARAGEFIRAHLNGKKEGISRSASFATIILERLFDGLTMLILLGLSLGLGHLPVDWTALPPWAHHAVRATPYLFGGVFLLLFTMLLFKTTAIRHLNSLIERSPRRFHEPLRRLTHTFFDGLKVLQSAKESFLVLLTSLAAWTCEFTAFYLVAVGSGIAPAPLTFLAAALLMSLVNLAILLPNAPGGIGIFEVVGAGILVISFGVEKETAVGYMFLIHFLVLVPITLLGFYYATREHISLQQLEAKEPKLPSRPRRRRR